jgi:hypothetical protein
MQRRANLDGVRLALALALLACATADASGASAAPESVFARVGDTTITRLTYESAVSAAVRGRFYHGKAPEAEVLKLRRDVGAALVDEVLLLKEAQRRRILADPAAVQKALDAQDARYRNNAEWRARRTELLPKVRRRIEEQSVLSQLEAALRNVPQPSAGEVEAYYVANADKFTEPEQLRVSLILLKVDPSSPRAKWDATREEAASIVKRLKANADFAQLARKHSADPSASKDGDLGYLHRGMLPEPAQAALDRATPGTISDPVVLLEGVAVLRLDERKPARLQPLVNVADRARDLWRREQGESAWRGLIARLRKENPAKIDESVYASAVVAGKAGLAGTAGR